MDDIMELSTESSSALFLTTEFLHAVRMFSSAVVLPMTSIHLFYFTHWDNLDGPVNSGKQR